MTEDDPFENMLSERKIINGLMVIAGLILGPYLVASSLENNQVPILIFGCSAFLFLIFFVIGDAICIFPLLGVFLTLQLNFIPLGFTAQEVFSIVLILYYVVAYLAMRQRRINFGPAIFFIPSFVIAAIILYHDHKFGLHAFGGSENGSRAGVLVLIAILAYFSGINIPTPPIKLLRWLPWLCLVMTCITAFPLVLTTYIPSTAPFMFHITANVNVGAYFESLDEADSTGLGLDAAGGRAGFLAGIAVALQVFLLSHFPINTWWRPNRWFAVLLSFVCLWLVLIGGYRSGFVMYLLLIFLGALCYCTWRLIFFVPLAAIALLAFIMIQNEHPGSLRLPVAMQRSMSFLPGGKWDPEVSYSTQASNDFRQNIKRVYIQEYLYKSPWVGNGFAFDPHESDEMSKLAQTADTPDRYYEAKAFIVVKGFHTGWISLYDAVGLVGSAAFLFFGGSMVLVSGLFVFGRGADRKSPLYPLKVWIFCYLAQDIVGYFTVFGSFTATFPTFCAYAIILTHLRKIERDSVTQVVLPIHQEPLGQRGAVRPLTA